MKVSCPFEIPLADILASYTALTLTIEGACTSSVTELIGAGYDRLDSQKRYATCNLKLAVGRSGQGQRCFITDIFYAREGSIFCFTVIGMKLLE